MPDKKTLHSLGRSHDLHKIASEARRNKERQIHDVFTLGTAVTNIPVSPVLRVEGCEVAIGLQLLEERDGEASVGFSEEPGPGFDPRLRMNVLRCVAGTLCRRQASEPL